MKAEEVIAALDRGRALGYIPTTGSLINRDFGIPKACALGAIALGLGMSEEEAISDGNYDHIFAALGVRDASFIYVINDDSRGNDEVVKAAIRNSELFS